MAPASRSPDESRERAVSSEPCSTARPNPFDDRDLSARKRQRTSLSGTSRSRSVESIESHHSQDSTAGNEPSTREDSVMRIDTDPSAPQTPERPRSQSKSATEPKSSRVTINLRNIQHPLETIPSSPLSPHSGITVSQAGEEHDVKASVEEPEIDMAQAGPTGATPASSTSDASSPPIEIVDDLPDDDDHLGGAESHVTLLHDIQNSIVADPTGNIPYHSPDESYSETVMKLLQFITNHEDVAPQTRDWLDSYLTWATNVHYHTLFSSYQRHRNLWTTLPELIYAAAGRKISAARYPHLPQCIGELYALFARLTALFVELDFHTVSSLPPDEVRYPELASPPYICALNYLTRRDEPQVNNGYLPDAESGSDDPTAILNNFLAFHHAQGGTLTLLFRLTQKYAQIIPRFPRLIEHFGHMSQLVHTLLRESLHKVETASGLSQAVDMAKTKLASSYQFYSIMSASLSLCMEKYVNHLGHDAASTLVNGLTDILRLSLQVDHIHATTDILKEHRKNNPAIPTEQTADVVALEWKFTTFSKMIMSSQMQLRMMAVTQMCQDLVALWKKQGEASEDPRSVAVLQYFAEYLLRTGLVAYILGPTCHPEITIESGNIIGFLLVTQTYLDEHADLMWQTVTSTQDPRVSDALLRMTSRIANLYTYEGLIYLCHKLQTLPIEAFNPTVRELCDVVFKTLPQKGYDKGVLDTAPFLLCLRLLRESSVFGPHSPVAFPDIQTFATQRFHDLQRHGPSHEGREELYDMCLKDLSEKNRYTLGSLWMVYLLSRQFLVRELQGLTAEHDLTRLIVDELENAIMSGRTAGFPCVIAGGVNAPRRELISGIMLQQPATITSDLGPRLWSMLVGPDASCREDREIAWQVLNHVLQRARANPFIQTCLTEYLPTLPPDCFCTGALDFVLEGIRPAVDDPSSIILDDEEQSPERAVIEQLWRMILTAPRNTIEQHAIGALVSRIYVDSKSILSFPHYRARKVHLALVTRCLSQLSSAAKRLKAFSDGTVSGDDEPMVIVASEAQIHEQELLFIRSLTVIREFLKLHQAKAEFAAPDLRSLILPSTKEVEGESAELKYQSFDGDKQTDIKPLSIGRRNTAGSLLASLRDETGFDNYRIYYKGQSFVPQERDICKSLDDLQIQNGLILVKRESDAMPSSDRIRPGASPVEIEILAHFEELWDYLSMEETLASEIYHFLIKLPIDDRIILAFRSGSTSYKDVFPLGQPFKSLYAIQALQECLTSRRRSAAATPVHDAESEDGRPAVSTSDDMLRNVAPLVVAAISDPEVVGHCSTEELQVLLSMKLVETLLLILKDPLRPDSIADCLDQRLLERLLAVLSFALTARSTDNSTRLATLSFHAILESCSASQTFWDAFCETKHATGLIRRLLLDDPRPILRKQTLKLIGEKLSFAQSPSVVSPSAYRAFFWPVICHLIWPALKQPSTCDEVFSLAVNMFRALRDADSPVLNLRETLSECSKLILMYTTYEDVTQPELVDLAAFGLIRLLHCILCSAGHMVPAELLPERGFARKLFWKHLFPPPAEEAHAADTGTVLHNHSRGMLIDIISTLVDQDEEQLTYLFEDLNRLVPYEVADDDEDPYLYDLPQQFDRSKAIRSSCGYVGLRNLSNTCYLNSLFTQLFMNVDFRQFMLNVEIRDPDYTQALLFQTSNLFGNLQDSIRRFVDPAGCVATIKTYEDSPIDIHNQMDVDEFYNLLFDRWEGQLLSAETKREFRSFYGGQLVQQVKSKECDHISERLEPFSAIQCDIKGKSTLQDSLQAYVDGEIMEGDNKYKCSTCDRHVDAVKRACLKDIPDNLIFHLKRFDFNLRTLQRSKINDYFSFPSRIDMRPYTIEHLSNSDDDASEDVFELVGVLVHSGTAESGHYYSYIRERPTTRCNDTWVEFNDDVVTPWDPSQMESSCFGGPDYRPPYDGTGIVYDKTYSAYMLFYQRASSLQTAQERLQLSEKPSPLRVDMPAGLADNIRSENTSLLRRHCLYDPAHIRFVSLSLDQMRSLTSIDGRRHCTLTHRMENIATEMAISHLDQVASRTKDVPDFRKLRSRVQEMCRDCPSCCLAVYEYFKDRPGVLRMLVQRNPEAFVRHESGHLLVCALQGIREGLPGRYSVLMKDPEDILISDVNLAHDIVHATAQMFRPMWDNFHLHIRSWAETFGLMVSFVNMGRYEVATFLAQDYLRKLLWIIMADPSMEMPQQYVRMLTAVTRRMPTRPPSYDAIISLAEALISAMSCQPGPKGGDVHLADDAETRLEWSTDDPDSPFVFTRTEYHLIFKDWARNQTNFFTDKLISLNQNHPATDAIIAHLMKCHLTMDVKIYHTLRLAITGQMTAHLVAPYLRVASMYCRISCKREFINALISYVAMQCRLLQNAEGRAFFEFHRDVFDTPRDNSGESLEEVYRQGLNFLPAWVPSLLLYFDPIVSSDVENFLHEKLFRYGPSPAFSDDNGGLERSKAVTDAVRKLGLGCMKFLKERFVRRNAQVAHNLIASMQRVITQCNKYFDVEDGSTRELNEEWEAGKKDVLEPLHKLVVEDLEEDASEWENSGDASSDQMDSVGDLSMQTVADPNEAEA
ncbi:Ubiquitin carboxyl-terminal hydrolase 34 [Pleurostoma richardsiae]|uniref:Ubiquitin carboxyl-terminal hydrolase 34 n=1 Tax=Pleurostoma richardsiae TaxID=41990 RepID=A0AA38VGN1_9PEZI|nr:Ubiquitin carboxyl-terminal hydrolase 34 [Pleurostoma richardsiae]